MALENSDVLVVQKQSGNKDLFKATLDQLNSYLGTHNAVNFRGVIDLTQDSAGQLNPSTPQSGDLYLNTTDGTLGPNYTGLTAGIDVYVDDRLVYNGSAFELLQGHGDVGVEEINTAAPITVDNSNPAIPIVGSTQATTSDAGHVARLATAADVAATTGTGATDAVVTADLLKSTNDALDAATAGGVNGLIPIDPIEVFTASNGGSTTSPAVGVKASSTTQLGVVQLASSADITNGTADRVVTADQLASEIAGNVTAILGTAPIQVDTVTTPGEAVISVDAATDTDDGVVKLANSGDITAGTAGKVVTADQLRTEIDNVDIDLISSNGTITIDKAGAPQIDIDVKAGLFLNADFSSYPDISTAP